MLVIAFNFAELLGKCIFMLTLCRLTELSLFSLFVIIIFLIVFFFSLCRCCRIYNFGSKKLVFKMEKALLPVGDGEDNVTEKVRFCQLFPGFAVHSFFFFFFL